MIQLLSIALGGISENQLRYAVPFTMASSFSNDNTVVYTTEGSREDAFLSVGCWILGVPWLVGGIMMLFASNPQLTAPAWIAYPVLLGGGLLFCISGYRLWGSSKRQFQIEIDRNTQQLTYTRTNPWHSESLDSVSLVCSMSEDDEFHVIFVEYQNLTLFILGVLRNKESAEDLLEVLSEETSLPIRKSDSTVSIIYSDALAKTDADALRKPMKSVRLKKRKS